MHTNSFNLPKNALNFEEKRIPENLNVQLRTKYRKHNSRFQYDICTLNQQ